MLNYPTLRSQFAWTPFSELRREVDRLFDDYRGAQGSSAGADADWHPACDVEEADGHFLLTLEMPGIPRDQIKIEVVDNQLTISGERRREEKKHDASGWYSERRYGRFQRAFTLPAGVDADKVEANYQDGVLRLYVPKAETAKPRQIKVGQGATSGFFGKLLGKESKDPERAA